MSAPTLTLSEATALASHTVAPCECTEPDAECTACEGHGHTCIICGDAWCTACWETADHNDGCKREVLPDGSIREAIGDTTTDLLGGFTRTLRVLAKDADDNGEPRAAMAYRWVLSSYGGDVARLRVERDAIWAERVAEGVAARRALAEVERLTREVTSLASEVGGLELELLTALTSAAGLTVERDEARGCRHPKCVAGFIETWQGADEPSRTPCPRCTPDPGGEQ